MVLSDAVAEVGIKGLCRVDFDIDMGAFPDVDMNCILIFVFLEVRFLYVTFGLTLCWSKLDEAKSEFL